VKRILVFFFAAIIAAIPALAQSSKSSIATQSAISASSFGFQCGTGKPTNCPNFTWPDTIAQPGMIRLWDSQVQWHLLNRAPGVYRWNNLDGYLDAIAAHQPRDAMYVFGYTPCWATKQDCERAWGSRFPPDDLTANGSESFNSFVLALVTHCSAAGHCVKDYIKYWEMWNEANAPRRWGGSVAQLYQLMAPAIATIRSKIPGAVVLTPPVNHGDTDWMREWLAQENTNGRLSDIYSLHIYLQNGTPETRFEPIQQMLSLKNNTAGWANTPWVDSETAFDATNFNCNGKFSPDDCLGQLVRWHLLQFAAGARHVSWFYFNTTIGHDENYSAAYHEMMQWLIGGHFTAACSASGNVYTCPFVAANGHHVLFAWNPNGDSSYTPGSQYVDYKTLSGSKNPISGKSVTVGVKPILLEAAN
jgi:hypothetical protein